MQDSALCNVGSGMDGRIPFLVVAGIFLGRSEPPRLLSNGRPFLCLVRYLLREVDSPSSVSRSRMLEDLQPQLSVNFVGLGTSIHLRSRSRPLGSMGELLVVARFMWHFAGELLSGWRGRRGEYSLHPLGYLSLNLFVSSLVFHYECPLYVWSI
jgi:hypothetical protein